MGVEKILHYNKPFVPKEVKERLEAERKRERFLEE